MNSWDVDVARLVSLLSDRMYSDLPLAGIRELIANSIDARWPDRPIDIDIKVNSTLVEYKDNGQGIQDFANTYGVIGSGAKDSDPNSIGMFGIGRLSLISRLRKGGLITSGSLSGRSSWGVSQEGWSTLVTFPKQPEPMLIENIETHMGFYLNFPVTMEVNPDKLIENINRIFSIPIYKKMCCITINDIPLRGLLDDDYTITVQTVPGDSTIYYKQIQDGAIHYCHNSVEVKTENFTGLDSWVDENHLRIKTDREGYVNDHRYQQFLRITRATIRGLRPKRSLQRLEVQFIDGVMRRFRRFIKKSRKGKSIPTVIFPKEIPIIPGLNEELPDHMSAVAEDYVHVVENGPAEFTVTEPPVGETPTGGVETEGLPEPGREAPITANLLSPESGASEEAPDTTEESPNASSLLSSTITSTQDKPVKTKKITIRGTRAVDLKTDYPMVFFEQEPFAFIFNTTHPILKEMIESEEMDRRTLGVIFERMLECFYFQDEDSLEDIRERWTSVDTSLQDLL